MGRYTLASVTSLRILCPILLVLAVFALFLRRKQLNRLQELRIGKQAIRIRTVILILLTIYMVIYVYLTFTYRRPLKKAHINLIPFWSYRSAIQFHPFRIKSKWLARQILLNILLTVPPGLLLPILWYKARHPYLLTAVIIFVLSMMTEILQYFTRLGYSELDDLIDNLLGGVLGMAVIACGAGIMRKKRKT